MKNILYSITDIRRFDFEKYKKSLAKYGFNDDELLRESLKEFDQYDNLHWSCLVELGVKLIPDEEQARAYWDAHQHTPSGGFERLRRITGYLVGSLERWNDGKKAEERERVKHSVGVGNFTAEDKDYLEAEKAKLAGSAQNEYHKGE